MACSFKLTVLLMLDICSLNVSWLSIFIPRSLTVFSLLTVSLVISMVVSSVTTFSIS